MYPLELNYKMPPEWDLHQRTLISWPVQSSMCYPGDYDKVCRGYAEIITAINEFEPVTLVINPEDVTDLSKYINGASIELLPIAHDDAWLRDNGPTFVVGPQRRIAGINWQFNAWGGKVFALGFG